MNTQTLTTESVEYLEAVREGLADLPGEDREEVLADLEAHLADLDTDDPRAALGTPEDFVREFRASAGLDIEATSPGPVRRVKASIGASAQRIGRHPLAAPYQRHRSELRTVWVWTRGWIFVSALWWVVGAWAGSTITFGLPWFEWGSASSVGGIVLVALATVLSVRLAGQRPRQGRATIDRLASLSTVLLALLAWLNPIWIDQPVDEIAWAQEATLYSNVYAYDRQGDPVEVLLYDQDGNPIDVTGLERWGPEAEGVVYDQWGAVRLERDAYGRPITNLYPLERLSDEGSTETIPPPRVAIPEFGEADDVDTETTGAAGLNEPATTTTISDGDELATTTTTPGGDVPTTSGSSTPD